MVTASITVEDLLALSIFYVLSLKLKMSLDLFWLEASNARSVWAL